ncbi:hypothetical protein HYH03_017558 [Edaphochlamys debaryana]|uniref:Uncharacterized protein n=1 Tax=Edaphochlamys debaryana TaxID=47281 RepID=A0A835XH20_9CHLO|nr:hypothetical protein HYH03_017558 [Edaphochlamys debaryana]|eukprot:KAG2483616.1 hypothetical protein HYH03_017558 [Edaphochlamys debaryana]
MGEVLAQLASVADVLLHKKGMADHRVTLVVPTPSGLAMTPYHHALIAPHSLYAPVSFDDMSTRTQRPNSPVPWSEEGHVSCFERVAYCKFYGFPQSAVETARTLLRRMLPLLPTNPLGFGPAGSGQPAPQPLPPLVEDTTFRVAIEARSGATRSFKNLHAIIDECAEMNKRGFRAGRFTSIACRVLHTGDTPDLHGLARFYANLGAVRSAHLLVAVHGAGAVNAAFMVRGGWAAPNGYMQAQLQRMDFAIRFFALNLADPKQCAPADYEAEHLANPDTVPLRGPEDHRARDQHVMPNPKQLLEYMRRVGTMLSDQAAYDDANRADKRHAYALPDGLVYGSLCVEDEAKLQTMEKQTIMHL